MYPCYPIPHMTPNATAAPDASRDEIMASVDTIMGTREYIIADVTRDGAWLSVQASEAVALTEWA
jgi:hypothetical protein